MIIIGFCGKAKSGKDTCGDYLKEKYGFVGTSFAAPLKEVVKTYFFLTDDDVYTQEGKERIIEGFKDPENQEPLTVRRALQVVGTDWFRSVDENYWVEAFQKHSEERRANKLCVTDLRFKNEFYKIKEMGGYVIKVLRTDQENSSSLQGPAASHVSETEWQEIKEEEFDAVLSADKGDVDGLLSKLDEFIETVVKSP